MFDSVAAAAATGAGRSAAGAVEGIHPIRATSPAFKIIRFMAQRIRFCVRLAGKSLSLSRRPRQARNGGSRLSFNLQKHAKEI
jgi:hypothetical protein